MQLFGYGRSDRSSKLIGGLESKETAGFRSRRGDGHDRIPVTSHNALFASYKETPVHSRARERGRVAVGGAGAAARPNAAHRRALPGRRKRSLGEVSLLWVHSSACGL